MKRLLRAILSALSAMILVAVLLGYLGGVVFSLDMLAHFRLHFLLLCLPIAMLSFVLGAWQIMWRACVVAILALAGLGALWESPERGSGDVQITLLAANLYHDNPETDEMRRVLYDADADVLVTSETTKSVLAGERSLALLYPFRLSLNTSGQTLRTVIWSKFPMRDGRLLLEDRAGPTGAHAIVEVAPGVEFSLLAVHMAHNLFGNQREQIEALDRIIERLPMPRVILGDFNATAWSFALRRVETLTSTRRVGGFRVTWQGAYPTVIGDIPSPLGLQIDHALVSDEVGVATAETIAIPGSDHRGLKVSLTLADS
ncbi:MAG: endonuclease/exonuclease/phosphatase family protein [Pseudomonadota bacterium]